jgi:hypothetical protein
LQETIQGRRQRENTRRESVPSFVPHQPLWFERLSSKLHLPLWFGIPVVSLAPAIVLWSLGINIRIATDFTGKPIISLPLLILNMLFLIASAKFISLRIDKLEQYTASLTQDLSPRFMDRLHSLTPIILIWTILVVASGLVFDPLIFGLHYTLYQSLLRVAVTSYLRLGQATFLWVLGYSMFSIYTWGRLPVRLKSFSEDPTLGLNPYGTASLNFVTLYVVGVLLTFPVGVYTGEAILISQSIFFLLGLVIFLGPLLGLRRRLLEAKQEKVDWIGARHKRVVELVESCGDEPLDIGIVNELLAVDSIRRDIQQIHTWPFNLGILAKLVTVVMLPLVLAMIATYLIHVLQL